MDLDASLGCPNEMFDNHRVLIALVLQPERMFGIIDELPEALTAVANTPDEVRMVSGSKVCPVPIGLETFDDLLDLVFMRSNDRVITSYCEVLGLPVE